jgi:serine/threonine protein kinase/tetratricopeptide (TPR) repeat protein
MLSSGSRFGRYEIRERLGAGGMGEVYRARDTELPRDVAIKLLSDPFVTNPARLARFATEARAASALNHPNILTVHDVGESAGQPFIVMECVEGKTLREVIGRTPMASRALLDIGVQIADGLAKAHAIGIVHRDLKPENVMVTDDGLVKIVDFGLAKPPVLDVDPGGTGVETCPASPTVHGAILGTVGYMAPEQACGKAADHRADQFALGAILYEMATGRRAFDCPTTVETLAATLDREPEPVAALNPTLPAQARWLIERCLAKKPKDRYASTDDLAHELRTIREHLGEPWPSPGPIPPTPPAPTPVLPPQRPPRFAVSRRVMVAGVLVLVAAVLASPLRSRLLRAVVGPPWPEKHILAVLPIASEGDVGEAASGLHAYLVARLQGLNTFDRGFSVLSAADVIGMGVATSRAAKDTLGATMALHISLARTATAVEVSFELVDTANASVLASDAFELAGTSRSRDIVVNQVVKALKVQLKPVQKALWAEGFGTDLHAETLYAQGLTAFQRGEAALREYEKADALGQAIRLLNEAVNEAPDNPAAWAALGQAYLRLYELKGDIRQLAPAEDALQKAIGLGKNRPTVWVAWGMLQLRLKHPAEAEQAFQRVIAINPAGADAYRELGLAYTLAGRFQQAGAQLTKALTLEPAAWSSHSYMGFLRQYENRLPEAAAAYRAGLGLAPRNVRLWSNLGGVYLKMGPTREKDAEDALSTANEIDPGYADAVSNFGVLRFRQRRDAEAADLFTRAAALSPDDPDLWRNLGSALYSATGDRERARPAYEKAASLYQQQRAVTSADPHIMVHLAACYSALGRAAEARSLVADALNRGLQDQDLSVAASVYDELGDRAAALEVIRATLARGRPSSIFEGVRSLETVRADPRYAAIVKAGTGTKTPSGR